MRSLGQFQDIGVSRRIQLLESINQQPETLNKDQMNFIMRIIVTSIVAFGLSYILKGIQIDSFWSAILLAIVLAVLNAFLKPILIILTLPITIVTLGLFLFVINAGIILLADKFIDGFVVKDFWWALLFSLLLSIVTSLLYKEPEREKKES